MNSVVIYKSKTGFAKKYAEWISKELDCDIYEESSFQKDKLKVYDTIIYGAGLYAVGINGLKKIKKEFQQYNDKKIVIFATGATPYREETIKEVRDANFSKEEQNHIKFFYLRGGFNYKKLKPIDKLLMKLMKFKIKIKKEKSPDDRGMLAAYNKPVDFSRVKNIEQLIEYVKE